jgi:hypothetical protein
MRYAGLSVGTAGLAVAVLLLTWWASGSADAAQPLMLTTVPYPLPRAGTWTWLLQRRDVLSEPGLIAVVGLGLIGVAALVRRSTT